MAEPFISQIEAFPFNFAPKGWAFCAGQLMPINQNQALFSLLGTTFGGDGRTNFALPDLRGRLANGFGQGQGLANYALGQRGGEETHTLTIAETPPHSHLVNAVKNGTTGGTNTPGGGVTLGEGYSGEAGSPAVNIYSSAAPTIPMGSLGPTGGQPHGNLMPYLALNYCIALQGVFPSRS
ncbi:MAG: tail fiber protein [Roseiarcus sp.]